MKKFKVSFDNNELDGTGKDILEFTKTQSFTDKSQLSLQDWVKEVQENVWRLYGIGIAINHNCSIEDQCESLVEQMISKGLIIEVK